MRHTLLLLLTTIALITGSDLKVYGEDYPTEEEIQNMLLPRPQMTRGISGVVSDEPSVTLRIHFKRNSAELMPAAKLPLQNLGRALQQDKLRGYVYKIEGHTCDLGSDAFNLDLSLRRAQTVRDYLVGTFNLSGDQLEIEGYGERYPAVPNTDETARQKNRRVVIKNTLRGFKKMKAGSSAVTVQLKCLRNSREEVVMTGDTLTSNDPFSLEFITKKSMYLYVFHIDANDKLTLIFPNLNFSTQDNPVMADQVYRIPEQRKWLQLDENKGKEHIVVVADDRALISPEEVCRQVISLSVPTVNGMRIVDSPEGGDTRGLMGIRKELRYDKKSLFVWESYFIHR